METNKLDKSKSKIQTMFAEISTSYDRANSVLSFGLHHIWKKELANVSAAKADGQRILDVCTGTGDILALLQRKNLKAFGIDFTLPMLKLNQALRGSFAQADALNLPFANQSFQVVTVSYGVRNFESLKIGLEEILRVLKPGGSLFVLEFGKSPQGVLGAGIRFYERTIVPILGGLISGKSSAYKYLATSSDSFPSGQDLIDICKEVGFAGGKVRSLTFGATYLYEISKGGNR